MLARTLAAFAAFCVGWTVYMIGMVLTVYEGMLSLILQPFMAAAVSGVFVGVSLVVGLLLKIPAVARFWTSTPMWAGFLASASVFVLTFGYFIGITYVGTHPETGEEVLLLHPLAALGGYFFLIFAVANWPLARKGRTGSGPA